LRGEFLRNHRVDVSNVGRGARATVGAVQASIIFPVSRARLVAVSRLASTGWIEADPPASGPLRVASEHNRRRLPALPPDEKCDSTARRPHIILLLDESSFDINRRARRQGAVGYSDYSSPVMARGGP